MVRALNVNSKGCGFDSRPFRCHVTSFHARATVTKQFNLVPVKGRWCCVAGKVTVGLASHWPCVKLQWFVQPMAWNSFPDFIRDPTNSTGGRLLTGLHTCSRDISASSALGVLNDNYNALYTLSLSRSMAYGLRNGYDHRAYTPHGIWHTLP